MSPRPAADRMPVRHLFDLDLRVVHPPGEQPRLELLDRRTRERLISFTASAAAAMACAVNNLADRADAERHRQHP